MHRLLTVSALFALTAPALAQAASVYPGCAAPSLKAGHHTFFVDPVHGSMQGDGSAAKPWHTLAEVLDTSNKLLSTMGHNTRTFPKGDTSMALVNPTGPIKAGDVVMLKSGNHGDVKIFNSFNTDFITVMAAPGQTPTLTSLVATSSAKWVFQGLKVMGASPVPNSMTALVWIGKYDWVGETSDFVVDGNTISTTDNTSSWSKDDWNNKPDTFLLMTSHATTCMSLTGNHLYNAMNGISFGSDHSLAENNLITAMRYDGIDFMSSNQIIRRNTIKDNTNDYATEIYHPDGIQGWSYINNGVPELNTNDLVDSNYVVKTGDGGVTQMQGITVFDGKWDGLKIINNVVVSNIWHGISIYGGKNVSIINNTVLGSDSNYPAGIMLMKDGSSQPGQNVVVRNNIATRIVTGYPLTQMDHNIIIDGVFVRDAANNLTIARSGVFGNANRINGAVANQFVTLNMKTGSFDLRLRPTSMAIAAGNMDNAPNYDIVERKRSSPADAGAYEH